MQICLGNGYYIEVERRNYILKHKYIGNKKDGSRKEYVKIVSHAGSLESVLYAFLKENQIPRESKYAVDLMWYASFIDQSNKEAVQSLKQIVEGIKKE